MSFVLRYLLAIVAVLFAVVALYSLRKELIYEFDTAVITIAPPVETDSFSDRLDSVLLENIGAFTRIRSYDTALSTKPFELEIERLWVDTCEVRQKEFQQFAQWYKLYNIGPGVLHPDQPEEWEFFSANDTHVVSGRLEAPANGVTYFDAFSYCRSTGGRLPTTAEWMAIAQGQERRLYPWGDSYNPDEWPYLDARLNSAQKCGTHPDSATPQGVQNMGGVVSEWAEPLSDELPPTVHGGNGYNQPHALFCLNSLYRFAPQRYRSPYVGFRCVYDYQPVGITPWQTPVNTVAIEPGTYSFGIPYESRVPRLLIGLVQEWIPAIRELFQRGNDVVPYDIEFMKHEVTREEYARFLSDPLVKFGIYSNKNEPIDQDYIPLNWEFQLEQPHLPVSGVDWWSALAYANWAGGRLPSANEWTSAASSRGDNLYPWGDVYESKGSINSNLGLNSVQSADDFARDITPTEIVHLGGNLSEWTRSVDLTEGGFTVLTKGGNYLIPGVKAARSDFSTSVPPTHKAPTIGIRLIF